jgi:ubiquinone/menaquinone biosynthesis C-methylase UbiE
MTSEALKVEIKEKVLSIIGKDTPDVKELMAFDLLVKDIGKAYRADLLSEEDLKELARSFGDDFLNNTMQGFGLLKPYGYAGDFMMIDKIYTHWESGIPKYKIWDEYFHNHAAPKAVRNRKKYFKKVFTNLASQTDEKLHILNVASGPARDLLEIMEIADEKEIPVSATCVDIDENAVQYARKLLKPYEHNVSFVHKNMFFFSSESRYDLVWSAGLFDYFNDRMFRLGLSKMKKWVRPGGTIIIGNFNKENNPSRDYMEIFGEWYLNHRTKGELINLALDAGFERENICVSSEEENVNLFLHINVPA